MVGPLYDPLQRSKPALGMTYLYRLLGNLLVIFAVILCNGEVFPLLNLLTMI
jgi:hypothetical protein